MKPYKLPALPFAYNALEPTIDEMTMKVHHDEHHRGYVDKLNDALEPYPDLQKRVEELLASLHTLPVDLKDDVANNAGGHANHSLYWTILTPRSQRGPSGELGSAIASKFGSFEKFQSQFTECAAQHFSNGWAWLASDAHGALSVFATKDHESPISRALTPLLVLDVWEHAYYLKHQNRRAEYIKGFWKIVNWKEVGKRWEDVRTKGATNREWKMTG
ncbi:MAG: superoxide dismutase [Deltaproteobacteria bacterium]|nr:superoxide dismutase [Deltaproteobacteria bacterium]